MPALTGAIMCMGVATANSILVVSFAREQMEVLVGDARQAALNAGFVRLRPVLMTALAMIIGMVPMALGLGDGGEQNAPLGRAVIGGLLLATVATLFFVPAFFSFIHGWLERRRKRAHDDESMPRNFDEFDEHTGVTAYDTTNPNPQSQPAADAATRPRPSRARSRRARPCRRGRCSAHPRGARGHSASCAACTPTRCWPQRTNALAAPTVTVAPAKPGAPVDNFVLPGNVTAYTDSPIYARTDGYLDSLVLRHRRASEKGRAAGRDRHARSSISNWRRPRPTWPPPRPTPTTRASRPSATRPGQVQRRLAAGHRHLRQPGRRHRFGGQVRAGQRAAAAANCNPSRRSMRPSTAWSPRATSTPAS